MEVKGRLQILQRILELNGGGSLKGFVGDPTEYEQQVKDIANDTKCAPHPLMTNTSVTIPVWLSLGAALTV